MYPYGPDLSLVIAFQSIGDWLVLPMQFFSFLGTENFYTLILPVLYWCIDASLGIRVGVIMLFSSGINFILKISFHGPRPYWMSSNVKPFWAETSFGVPSNHAQQSVAIWGFIADYLKKIWVWVVAIFLMLMIGLSRPFLGAHFFVDILGGWLLGALLLWLFIRYWDAVVNWVCEKSLKQQIAYAFSISLGLILVGWLMAFLNQSFVLPESWLANAARIGDEKPAPFALSGIITSAATLFGLLVGVAWMATRDGWQASGPIWMRAARYVVGVIGVLIIWNGLGLIFPRGEALLPYVLRYIRYALLGLWVSAGAPLLFTKLKLS